MSYEGCTIEHIVNACVHTYMLIQLFMLAWCICTYVSQSQSHGAADGLGVAGQCAQSRDNLDYAVLMYIRVLTMCA